MCQRLRQANNRVVVPCLLPGILLVEPLPHGIAFYLPIPVEGPHIGQLISQPYHQDTDILGVFQYLQGFLLA